MFVKLGTALGLKPDSSKYTLQINFLCLLAKYYIWLCKLKERLPKLNEFLGYKSWLNLHKTYIVLYP